MRKTSAIRCVSVALALSLLLGGCAGAGERASRANGRMDIAVVAKGYASPFWATTKAGAMAAGRDLGVDVTFNGPDTESDVVRQVDQLNLAYAMKPNALVVAALDESASIVALRQFKDRGIPVVAFDSGVPGSDIPVTTVSTDNYGSAREAAKHMVKLAGGKGELAVLGTSATSVTGRERRDGFVDYIKENAPGMKVVAIEYNESDQAKAESQASAILQAHPHLAGIFATDDDGAVAAGQTVARSGKNVIVVGYDSGKVQQDMIRNGEIAGSVTQNPYQMGYRAVTQAVRVTQGEKMPQQIDSGFAWYDAKNIDDPKIREALYD